MSRSGTSCQARTRAVRRRRFSTHRQQLCSAAGHLVVAAVTAETVNARDVAQQLARGDRPLLLRIRGHIGLDRGIEIDALAVVQQRHPRCGQRFRDAAGTEPRARRHRRAALARRRKPKPSAHTISPSLATATERPGTDSSCTRSARARGACASSTAPRIAPRAPAATVDGTAAGSTGTGSASWRRRRAPRRRGRRWRGRTGRRAPPPSGCAFCGPRTSMLKHFAHKSSLRPASADFGGWKLEVGS